MKNSNKWPRIFLVLLILIGIFLHFYKITAIKDVVFDEVYFAKFGQDYLTFNECPEYLVEGDYEADKGCYDVHPPLGKLMIAGGEKLIGLTDFRRYFEEKKDFDAAKTAGRDVGKFQTGFTDREVLGWRFSGAVFGLIFIGLMYILGTLVFKNEWWGLMAAFLATIDNYFLTQSRLALIDIYLISFQLAAIILFIKAYLSKTNWRYLWYAGSGVLAGCALGVKFNGLSVVGVLLAVLLYDVFVRVLEVRSYKAFFGRLLHNLVVYLMIIIVGGLTFFGILYLPQAIFGHEFPWETDLMNKYTYHKNLTAKHPYASSWEKWPLSKKPVFYYYNVDSVEVADAGSAKNGEAKQTEEVITAINGHGNPLLWWFGDLGMICVALMLIFWTMRELFDEGKGKAENHWSEVVILVGFFASWLPWIFIGRVVFLYHFLPAVPFLFLAAVWLLKRIWVKKGWGRMVVAAILVLMVVTFVYYLPMTMGLPQNRMDYDARWFS